MYPFNNHNERIEVDTFDSQIFWEEIDNINNALGSELAEVVRCLNEDNNSQIWRRVYCRTFFAYLEGQAYFLRQLFLFYDWYVVDDDIELKIRNQKVIKKKDGSEKTISAYLPLIDNFKLIFDAFAKSSDSEPLFSHDNKSWENLSKAVEIRNRIVHPKSSEELIITDEELDLLHGIGQWYTNSVIALLQKRADAYSRLIQNMSSAANKWFSTENS